MSMPIGYKILEYIQSSGTQYINTEFIPNQDTRIDIVVEPLLFQDSTLGSYFFSSAYPTLGSGIEFYVWSNRLSSIYNGNEIQSQSNVVSVNDKIRIDYNKNITNVYKDENNIFSASHSYSNFTSNIALHLFVLPRETKYYGVIKLYSCRIYDNGTLIRDFIPCQNSSGVVGLWDQLNETFYSNAGTGSFAAGPVLYEVLYPPTDLTCTVSNGTAHLSWDETASEVDGYKIYQNGVLIGVTPYSYPLFQFPFSNESLTQNLLELSETYFIEFDQPISPYTQYIFSVTAYKDESESDPISINVYYESYLEIISINLVPNPVSTGASFTVSVDVDEIIDINIT